MNASATTQYCSIKPILKLSLQEPLSWQKRADTLLLTMQRSGLLPPLASMENSTNLHSTLVQILVEIVFPALRKATLDCRVGEEALLLGFIQEGKEILKEQFKEKDKNIEQMIEESQSLYDRENRNRQISELFVRLGNFSRFSTDHEILLALSEKIFELPIEHPQVNDFIVHYLLQFSVESITPALRAASLEGPRSFLELPLLHALNNELKRILQNILPKEKNVEKLLTEHQARFDRDCCDQKIVKLLKRMRESHLFSLEEEKTLEEIQKEIDGSDFNQENARKIAPPILAELIYKMIYPAGTKEKSNLEILSNFEEELKEVIKEILPNEVDPEIFFGECEEKCDKTREDALQFIWLEELTQKAVKDEKEKLNAQIRQKIAPLLKLLQELNGAYSPGAQFALTKRLTGLLEEEKKCANDFLSTLTKLEACTKGLENEHLTVTKELAPAVIDVCQEAKK